jgi:hypothetical protein
MSKSRPSKIVSNESDKPSKLAGIHVSKTTKIGASGVVVGALVAGPIGALVGGVLGTALGAAASHPKEKSAGAKKRLAPASSAKPKRKAAAGRAVSARKKPATKAPNATKKKR